MATAKGEEDIGSLGRRTIDNNVARCLLVCGWGRHPTPLTLLTCYHEDRGKQTVVVELPSTEGM
jgi:hypothetical protein